MPNGKKIKNKRATKQGLALNSHKTQPFCIRIVVADVGLQKQRCNAGSEVGQWSHTSEGKIQKNGFTFDLVPLYLTYLRIIPYYGMCREGMACFCFLFKNFMAMELVFHEGEKALRTEGAECLRWMSIKGIIKTTAATTTIATKRTINKTAATTRTAKTIYKHQ